MKNPILTTVFLMAVLFCVAKSGSITVTSYQQRSDVDGVKDFQTISRNRFS